MWEEKGRVATQWIQPFAEVDPISQNARSLLARFAVSAQHFYELRGVVFLMVFSAGSCVSDIYNFTFIYTEYARFGSPELQFGLACAIIQLLIAASFLIASAWLRLVDMRKKLGSHVRTVMAVVATFSIICNIRVLGNMKAGGAFDIGRLF